jgi:putative flippase GtrA
VQFVVFGLIGVWNTIFDIVVWKVVVIILERAARNRTTKNWLLVRLNNLGLNRYSFAQGVSFVAANTLSYFLNRYITFRDSIGGNNPAAILRFFTVSLFALIISVLLINFLTKNQRILNYSNSLSIRISKIVSRLPDWILKLIDWPRVAKVITIAITLLINFVGYKFWVF